MKSKLLVAGVLSVLGVAQAHHSASLYDLSKTRIWTGELSKVEWIAPHVLVHLDVKDAAGKAIDWTYEGPPPAWYKHQGLKRADVEKHLGETVKIMGAPAHTGVPLGLLMNIQFPDGTKFEYKLPFLPPQ